MEAHRICPVNPCRVDTRNALLCALVGVIACVLVWPRADVPFNDDWSFSFTVKRLSETGHLIYNGWSSPSLIGQAYWGLIWVKVFGFSFNVLRFSTIVLAGGSVGLTYLLGRGAGLGGSAAVFAALMLALSPLFLPLATSFMTDVPGCFWLLLCLYALVKSTQSRPVQWMIAGVIFAAIGGSGRQIVWVVPLCVLPYLAIVGRKDYGVVGIAIALWLGTVAAAVGIQHWFESQPYSIPEPSLRAEWIRVVRDPGTFATHFFMILLTLVLITLPAGVTIFMRLRRSRPLVAVSILGLLCIGRVLLGQRRYAVGPWMINILSGQGVLAGGLICGERPNMLGWPVFAVLSLIVFATIAVLIALLILNLSRPVLFGRRMIEWAFEPSQQQIATASMVLVSLGYLALLLTRCAMDFMLFDRHLLGLIACVGIPLLRLGRQIPIGSWVLLALFGMYGIGSTQENLACTRARATAVQRLRAAGIPRAQISGGFDYDAWTQLEITGYINDSRIKLPVGAFHPGQTRMPDVKPIYRIEYSPTGDSVTTPFGGVSYFSLWPPFGRHVLIDRISRN